jgi:uncharacterized BrkB/YihY/UPF0761 family membrane protein
MWVKVVVNVLYNICIFICLIFIYSSVKNHNWAYVLGATFICAMVIIFKLRLIKDIKSTAKKS